MSYLFNSVNNVKASSNGNIDIGISSFLSSPLNDSILCIDESGNSKKLIPSSNVGNIAASAIEQPSTWGGSPTVTEGYNIFMGYNSTIKTNSSFCTMHRLSNNFITGWTLSAGNYLIIASWAFDTNAGGDCNAQFYNATAGNYVGPKIHFETGRFSNLLIYHANISSSTRFEIRARDVNSVQFFDYTSQQTCILQVLKV
jgi:hypothetical protein